jgi:hypothetical protein
VLLVECVDPRHHVAVSDADDVGDRCGACPEWAGDVGEWMEVEIVDACVERVGRHLQSIRDYLGYNARLGARRATS